MLSSRQWSAVYKKRGNVLKAFLSLSLFFLLFPLLFEKTTTSVQLDLHHHCRLSCISYTFIVLSLQLLWLWRFKAFLINLWRWVSNDLSVNSCCCHHDMRLEMSCSFKNGLMASIWTYYSKNHAALLDNGIESESHDSSREGVEKWGEETISLPPSFLTLLVMIMVVCIVCQKCIENRGSWPLGFCAILFISVFVLWQRLEDVFVNSSESITEIGSWTNTLTTRTIMKSSQWRRTDHEVSDGILKECRAVVGPQFG